MLSKKRIQYQLYRLQQKVAITRHETYALLILFGLIMLGSAVQVIQKNRPPFDLAIYAETDSLFEAATAEMRRKADSLLSQDSLQSILHKTPSADTIRSSSTELSTIGSILLAGEKININLASQAELETLPRIGPAMAQRIIDYRTEHGSFRTVDELLEVKGIGPKTLQRLSDRVTVR